MGVGQLAEEWRPVPGFEQYYEVSNLGRVRSLPRMIRTCHGATKRHQGTIRTAVADKDGYPRVVLRIDGKFYTRSVHSLVARAFHGDKKNALHREVDHLDNDRSNARADNLRWVSHAQNVARREWQPNQQPETYSCLSREQAQDIFDAKGQRTAKELAAKYGISPYTIYDIWRGKRWRGLRASIGAA